MEQSPSWRSNRSSVSPENHPFYENRVFITPFTIFCHLSLFWVRLIQSVPTSHFLKIHFNIIFPSIPRSSKFSLTLKFPHHKRVCISSLSNTCHMPRPSHSSWFDHPNNISWAVQIINLLIMHSSPLFFYLVPHRPKYLPQHPILKHCQSMFLPNCERPRFTSIKENRRNYISVYINILVLTHKFCNYIRYT